MRSNRPAAQSGRPGKRGAILWAGLSLLSLAGGCGLGAEDGFAPLRPTDNFHAIKEGTAFRSAQLDATTLARVIRDHDIRTVINLRGENIGEPWYDGERETCDALDVALVDIAWSATALPSREKLLKLFDTFNSAEQPILIHCAAGADRTGAASVIWRMQVLGEPRGAAADELSVAYGHFEFATPAMDELVRIFVPDREWILNEYPVP